MNARGNSKFYSNKPKISDIQIITFCYWKASLWVFQPVPNLVHRTTFNRRRGKLTDETAQLSKLIGLKFSEHNSEHVINSVVVRIYQKPRMAHLKICRDKEGNRRPGAGYHGEEEN
jgi:hypothetical protein